MIRKVLCVIFFSSCIPYSAALDFDKIAVVPFEMRAGYPFVDIDIAGDKYHLLIDMNEYRQLTLATDVLEKVPHKVLNSEKYVGGHEKVFFLKQFIIDEVGFGSLTKHGVKGTEEAFDPNYPTPSPLGAIGASMFFDDVIALDFLNRHLIINPAGSLDRCEPLAALGIPLVAVAKIDGKDFTFLLDVAYQYSVIDSNVAAGLRRGKSAQRDNSQDLLMESLAFQNFDLDNVLFFPLSMDGSGLHGVIGMDVFRRYNLAIDFPNNCFNLPLANNKSKNPFPIP